LQRPHPPSLLRGLLGGGGGRDPEAEPVSGQNADETGPGAAETGTGHRMGGKRMNTRDYRNAMDQLNPAPDLEGRIKEQLNLPSMRQAHPRRLAGKVLAAAAAIACTFMVAMAVSPQLRAAVLTFFHLEETEQVPG